MSINQKDNTLYIHPELPYESGVMFKKRVNFLINNNRGPTGSMIVNGLIYSGIGIEWSAGVAPGVRVDAIDFDKSFIELYFSSSNPKSKMLLGPSLFGNIGSENYLLLNIFSHYNKAIIGIDSYVVNIKAATAKFISTFQSQFVLNTLAMRYCDTKYISQNVVTKKLFCAK